ncbi:MAG TPA: ABC transporter permease [Anaerovoracaceae bacterium]|nr:ABC transporter permease [Anaerovoracaceae bacterium]
MDAKKSDFIWRIGILIIFLALWELASRLSLVNPVFLPPFSAVLANTFKMFADDAITYHLLFSLSRAAVGFATAVAVGLPAGFFMAAGGRRMKLVLEPLADVLAQINPFILLHLLVLFMGIGEPAKITIVFWACVWPIVFNTAAGVAAVDRLLLKAGRGFGSGRYELFRKIILPAASPKIFSGVRIGAGYSVFMLIAAEMMGGRSGLGWLILNDQVNYQIRNVFSIALVIAILGVVIDVAMELVQKKLMPYDVHEYVNSSNI